MAFVLAQRCFMAPAKARYSLGAGLTSSRAIQSPTQLHPGALTHQPGAPYSHSLVGATLGTGLEA